MGGTASQHDQDASPGTNVFSAMPGALVQYVKNPGFLGPLATTFHEPGVKPWDLYRHSGDVLTSSG